MDKILSDWQRYSYTFLNKLNEVPIKVMLIKEGLVEIKDHKSDNSLYFINKSPAFLAPTTIPAQVSRTTCSM